jgi:UPF0176 protein
VRRFTGEFAVKASAYFKHKVLNVYQLEGGIINYAKQIKEKT